MPQTVNITVTGLCLFAPGGDGQMYVLLPATGHAGDGSVPPHRPVLRFDPHTVESGAGEELDIDGLELHFGPGGGVMDPSFARGVVDLHPYTGAEVPGRLFTGGGDGALAARVAFPSGRMRGAGILSCWTMRRPRDGGEERRVFSNQTVWTDTLDDGAGPLVIRGGAVGSGERAPLVAFRRDVPVLSITLSHDVPPAHCCTPRLGSENEHFQAYHRLLDDSAAWNLPRFAGEGACGAGGVFAHGTLPYTCLVGGIKPPVSASPLPETSLQAAP